MAPVTACGAFILDGSRARTLPAATQDKAMSVVAAKAGVNLATVR
jgi:hypothetical protein